MPAVPPGIAVALHCWPFTVPWSCEPFSRAVRMVPSVAWPVNCPSMTRPRNQRACWAFQASSSLAAATAAQPSGSTMPATQTFALESLSLPTRVREVVGALPWALTGQIGVRTITTAARIPARMPRSRPNRTSLIAMPPCDIRARGALRASRRTIDDPGRRSPRAAPPVAGRPERTAQVRALLLHRWHALVPAIGPRRDRLDPQLLPPAIERLFPALFPLHAHQRPGRARHLHALADEVDGVPELVASRLGESQPDRAEVDEDERRVAVLVAVERDHAQLAAVQHPKAAHDVVQGGPPLVGEEAGQHLDPLEGWLQVFVAHASSLSGGCRAWFARPTLRRALAPEQVGQVQDLRDQRVGQDHPHRGQANRLLQVRASDHQG